MAKIHVWMLYQGGPKEPACLPEYFKRQMADPFLLNLGRSLFARLWMRVLSWWRESEVQRIQLSGPCPSHQCSDAQSRELNRILGSDYRCSSVHLFDGSTVDQRLKETPVNITVLLLPMIPFQGSILQSALSNARHRLQEQEMSFIEAPPLSQNHQFAQCYAECIRSEILSLEGSRSYAVLLLIGRDALNWTQAEEELLSAIQAFHQELGQALQCEIPILTALKEEDVIEQLQSLHEVTHVLYGYPSWICDSYETLSSTIAELPFSFQPIPSLNNRPSFIRFLAELTQKHAPVAIQQELSK